MRCGRALFVFSSVFPLLVAARAQVIPGPRWYRSASGMLRVTPANASGQELERLERYLVFGRPGCATLAPQQYAMNQALARNMAGYLATVATTAADLRAKAAAARLTAAFTSFPCAFPDQRIQEDPPPPPQPGDPPFSLKAPNLGTVPDEQQETAADLVIRYETDAVRSASAWTSAEKLRINLAGQGLSLNQPTATAVERLPLLYKEAEANLREHKWEEALSNLQATEATTQKIATATGR